MMMRLGLLVTSSYCKSDFIVGIKCHQYQVPIPVHDHSSALTQINGSIMEDEKDRDHNKDED